MIELFSKKPEWMPNELENRYTPISIDDDILSLSAILLDNEYYDFLKKGQVTINGLSVLSVDHLIPFKAKAWIDLVQRKNHGERIDSKNIKKHKNDIFRLSNLLIPNKFIHLTEGIKTDMANFLVEMEKEEVDLKQLGITGITKQNVLGSIANHYQIKEAVGVAAI